MPKLFLLRHFQSQWNLENRFTGWVDVPLSKGGIREAKKAAQKISKLKIDIVYTSPLIRNLATVLRIWEHVDKKYPIFIHFKGKKKEWAHFKELNKNYLPVLVSEKLNERYYGKLQGRNKKVTIKKYGFEKVRHWRRGFKYGPPGGEKFEEVFRRAVPFFRKYIEGDLKRGKIVLVVASHNSLRALVKYIENISDQDVINLEIPTASLTEYNFDASLRLKSKKIL